MSRLLKKLKETPDVNFSSDEEIAAVAFDNSPDVVSENDSGKNVVHSKIAIGVLVATIFSLLIIIILFNKLSDDDEAVSKNNAVRPEIKTLRSTSFDETNESGSNFEPSLLENFITAPNANEMTECIDSACSSINEFGETLYKKICAIKDKVINDENVAKRETNYLDSSYGYKNTSTKSIPYVNKNTSNYNVSKIYYNPEIQKIVDDFKITGLRLDGKNSKIMIDGDVYYVNSVICQKPKVKVKEMSAEKLIFSDEKGGIYERQL